MHPASEHHIPEGLLAASLLLNENSRLGLTTKNHALNQGIHEDNSTAAIGLRAGLALNAIRQSERARYYASTMGRWMSPDWSVNPIPIPFARLDNPQTLNLYVHVGNNRAPLLRSIWSLQGVEWRRRSEDSERLGLCPILCLPASPTIYD
jgi:hypothetical protein